MAQSRRIERVAALIRREASELLLRKIRDERVHQGIMSITEVEVAGDLQHCKIFVSVFGTEEERQQTLLGLQSAAVFIRGELGRRLKLRRAPEIIFRLDRGIEKGSAVLNLLNEIEQKRIKHKIQEDDDMQFSSFT
ncbi:ribosome-binding factor A (chromatophore) [Paulinella micropora]|uniref:Ribosome-binding factor A n=1 Tax=Paulinella micropora TaxID=1928728 RepID=A0A1L5YBJ1_9EUKA|nr:ribosome-binding factor A [Paulinella micropora]AQX44840.1 ribosome-binding factor A [Paulinella micropora]BBL86054.1 ribosome-binding factor A [Paulinella micropora]